MNLKIGQEITMTDDFEIESVFKNKVTVRKGDKGVVDSNGMVHYKTGEARGKIQPLKDAIMKGYDYNNISEMIYKRLKSQFNIDEYLEVEDIPERDFIEEIRDVLFDIL